MFRLDLESNSITRVERRTFSSLSYNERSHLQEWIAGSPECLGEELLIIQKEFDGFDETRERLDLLALDKNGQVVVIENKLDDSGRDVVWQALKYASYCAALTRAKIVDIYRRYLQAHDVDDDPEALIAEFLEVGDLREAAINPGADQRLILIAANFRREVTSTVLWLRQHQIDIRCIRAAPYKLGDEILLNFEQIIPVPEAADFMIGISEKDAEQSVVRDSDTLRYRRRREFWTACLEALHTSDIRLYDNVNPTKDHWLSAGSGVRSCPYQLIFGKNEARVQLDLGRFERAENKALFDALLSEREAIDRNFGSELTWNRLDHRKSSRIEFQETFDSYDEENWPAIIGWMIENLGKLHQAIDPVLKRKAAQVLET